LLKIRLSRVGKKKQPTYRIVVADARSARDGAVIEVIGRYNPRSQPKFIEIDSAKAHDWMRKGAQPTDVVARLLKGQFIDIAAGEPATAGASSA
jgi:small subunit ribosomal protein S16